MSLFTFSALTKRRWHNFRSNRRAYYSLWVFLLLFIISLFAEFVANEKPIAVKTQNEWRFPVFSFYSEMDFGGDFLSEADYRSPLVQCLIYNDGNEICFDDDTVREGNGAMIWPPIPYSFNTITKDDAGKLQPPSSKHWFGSDSQRRDVLARLIYGFRITVMFAFIVTGVSSIIAIILGAIMGYYGGRIDLYLQRFVEIWSTMPTLFIIIILSSFLQVTFWPLVIIVTLFHWTALVNLVRAEFLRARNFEYVTAAKALGVPDRTIIFRHVLPNAIVATITMMPFLLTGAIGTLATLDYLGFGLPANYPSLGEMAREAKSTLNHGWWLIWAAFLTYSIILSLLIFIFEGVRDAFDPRKVFK